MGFYGEYSGNKGWFYTLFCLLLMGILLSCGKTPAPTNKVISPENKAGTTADASEAGNNSNPLAKRAAGYIDVEAGENNNDSATEPNYPTEQKKKAVKLIKADHTLYETIPFSFPLPKEVGDGITYQVTNAPSGAKLDNGYLHWLPGRGQVGLFTFNLDAMEGEKVLSTKPYTIQVKQLPDDFLKFHGPAGVYDDADIGYIFVHGKTSTNLCTEPTGASSYWQGSEEIIAPNEQLRTLVCYDGTEAVENVAKKVAESIIAAPCGKYGKCIVITHSMGGLVMEHIFLHSSPKDVLRPALYKDHELYKKVKLKTAMTISIASAAGGSRAADMVLDLNGTGFLEKIEGSSMASDFQKDSASTESLTVAQSSAVLAPASLDPEVLFMMVPGYSPIVKMQFEGLLDIWLGEQSEPDPLLFNGSIDYARVDSIVGFSSRSDGVIAFRSSCGIKSYYADDGPGHDEYLNDHVKYCVEEPKKDNHYVWFLSELHHNLVAWPVDCVENNYRCNILKPSSGTFSYFTSEHSGKSAIHTIRALLTAELPYDATNPSFLIKNLSIE